MRNSKHCRVENATLHARGEPPHFHVAPLHVTSLNVLSSVVSCSSSKASGLKHIIPIIYEDAPERKPTRACAHPTRSAVRVGEGSK